MRNKTLLDNATLNHSAKILGAEVTSGETDELYESSLNNLINAIVLCPKLYVIGLDTPAYWETTPLHSKLASIVTKLHLAKSEHEDFAAVALGKAHVILTSDVGSQYFDKVLKDACRQAVRKGISFDDSAIPEKVEQATTPLVNELHENSEHMDALFLAYCRARFGRKSLSVASAKKLFLERYGAGSRLGISMLYWLVYRTCYYDVIADAYCLHGKNLELTYFPTPIRSELSGLDAYLPSPALLAVYERAIRQYDEEAAAAFSKETNIQLVIAPMPSLFGVVVNSSASLVQLIDNALKFRDSGFACDVREIFAKMDKKAADGEASEAITRDLFDLRDLVFDQWSIPAHRRSSADSSLALEVGASFGIGNVKLDISGLSWRRVERVRRKMLLRRMLRKLRSYARVVRDTHSIPRFYDLPLRVEESSGETETLSDKRIRVRKMLADAPEQHAKSHERLLRKQGLESELARSSILGYSSS